MNEESGLEASGVYQGTAFWTDKIKKAGLVNDLGHFNDVIIGDHALGSDQGYGDGPVLTDVMLDGKQCDLYQHPGNDRVYIYFK